MLIQNIKIFLSVVFTFSTLCAQDSYEEWLKKENESYQQFLDEEDKAFADFLEKEWKAYQTQRSAPFFSKPKPPQIPVAQKEDAPKQNDPETIKAVPPLPVPDKTPKQKPVYTPKIQIKQITYHFFGAKSAIEYDKWVAFNLTQPIDNKAISKAYKEIASSTDKNFVKQLRTLQGKYQVNDWGYIQLVFSFSQKIFENEKNKQLLLTWYLLLKSGYNAKIAYKENDVLLLLPNQNMIYNNQYVTLENKKFYFVPLGGKPDLSGKIYTYEGEAQKAAQLPAMIVKNVPALTNDLREKTLTFKHNGKESSITVKYDYDIIRFFENYPQTDLRVYFNAPISGAANYSLLNELKKMIEGKNELEAVNLLLHFAQTAFEYQTDDQQFGYENYLMPEETIFYPASDCEDRTILFTYLIKELIGLEIIVLDYPGHIASAVAFNSAIQGDAVLYKNKKYIVCDPTYINADAGMCMPQYKTTNPKIIDL
jgi:hypothetical protein